ncbi:DUF255 domain-containing protein [Colwellia sp. RSH04]|uniref:DUF255 domain-containing protein n=1 Tax=Colwellia sp. RSH04 TaxID=2305464 RepID=UPI000E578D9A|nr:DUF255 domain-containing protein [Colwellia sp. RSH04]RHW74893.1 DUF255 domain-containing protein [Colwellia sp. RSH04]
MRFSFFVLVFLSSQLFADEYRYHLPVKGSVEQKEFAKWQLELTKKSAIIDELLKDAKLSTQSTRYLNRLIFQASPYLLRHAVNPVNWFAWQEQALLKAAKTNKLIFLSIGYSTCHWCHVMEKESFANITIAEVLNEAFISIKVDRELTPDIDQYFTEAIEMATGSAGWPINAILTPAGDVIWINSYLTPANLSKTLKRLATVWQANPKAINQVAKNFTSQLTPQKRMLDLDWSIEKSLVFAQELSSHLDNDNGGLKGERKFPDAAALQFLLYQYQLSPSVKLKSQIEFFLNQLAKGGLRDHLHGGFYRYVIDSTWQQPHFEKMLYNQALLISVFSKAYEIFENESYLLVVIDTINFVNSWFKANDGLFYSAIDADYQGKEGRYYLFTKQELMAIEPSHRSKFKWCQYNVTELRFPCLLLDQSDLTEAKLSLLTNKYSIKKPHIDKKHITAWNALMVSAFLDAYKASNNKVYLAQAEDLALAILKQNQQSTGELIRSSYLNNSANSAVLTDYAYLGEALFELYQETRQSKWYQLSIKLYKQGSKSFGKNYKDFNLSNHNLLNDGELISGHTVLASLGQKLRTYGKQLNGEPQQQMAQLKQASANSSGSYFSTHELFLKNEYGVFNSKQYFARGMGEVRMQKEGNTVNLLLNLEDGWHINSNSPLDKYLIPTELTVGEGLYVKVNYPREKVKSLGFSQSLLSLFEGQFTINLELPRDNALPEKVKLRVQACNDKLCLLPETLSFMVPTDDTNS